MGEPIQSYNSKTFHHHRPNNNLLHHNSKKVKYAGGSDEELDVGKVGDENVDMESKCVGFLIEDWKIYAESKFFLRFGKDFANLRVDMTLWLMCKDTCLHMI